MRTLAQNPTISAAAIAQEVGISSRAVEKQLAKLKLEGRVERVGPDKGGFWVVVDHPERTTRKRERH